jgi:geranylgeranyl pyrophosphate synthase
VSKEQTAFFNNFGTATGTAFQIQDDLIDILGDPKSTGKKTFQDMEEGQHTYVTQHVFDTGSARDRLFLTSVLGTRMSVKQRKKLLGIFEKTGAIENARAIANRKLGNAVRYVQNADIALSAKESLSELLAALSHRSV